MPLFTLFLAIALVALQPSAPPLDLRALDKYSEAWGETETRTQFEAEARADFGGRGVEVADYFLRHTGTPPRNDAFFFILRSVADVDTALALIRALPRPPAHESGLLDRYFGEVGVAIAAVLEDDSTSRDPRVVAALEEAIVTARRLPESRHEVLELVRLLGMARSTGAAGALSRLAADPDAQVRTAAAAALGQSETGGAIGATPASPASQLLRLLASDPSPSARQQAAASLALVEGSAIDEGLRDALDREREPPVVDSIIGALQRRGAPVSDARCRGLVARAWEAHVAQQMLECWRRQGATREELLESATTWNATGRAATLVALTSAATPGSPRRLMISQEVRTVSFEPAVRDRLLESAVWSLSQGDAISASTRDTAEQALWMLSEQSMGRAIDYADRVTPTTARFQVSAALASANAAAYDRVRRPRQSAATFAIAFAVGMLGIWRARFRRPLLLMAVSIAGWAAWMLQAGGVRNLPPAPLAPLTVAAVAFLSAGLVAAAASMIPRRGRGVWLTIVRVTLTLLGAALVAGVTGLGTRSARLFPSDLAGWEVITDPLAMAVFAVGIAAVLLVVDRALRVRRRDQADNW